MTKTIKARTPILALILFVFAVGQAVAADKVVVIPMWADAETIAAQGENQGCNISFPNGESIARCSFEIVPAGKTMVVEFISGNFDMPEG